MTDQAESFQSQMSDKLIRTVPDRFIELYLEILEEDSDLPGVQAEIDRVHRLRDDS